MIDADHVDHAGDAVGVGIDVRHIVDRPDADHAAGRGDGARVVGGDQPRPRRRAVAEPRVRQQQRLGRAGNGARRAI